MFLHWGTAITAAIDIAIPLYKQSLTRMKFCPWKESGHRFTHLVCSPLNFTHVSNCSWQGHNRVYTCDLEKLLFFSCRAICLPRPQFPLETALFVTGHPTSLWLTREMTVIQVLGYGCGAFLSLLFRGTTDVTLPCLKAVVKRAG